MPSVPTPVVNMTNIIMKINGHDPCREHDNHLSSDKHPQKDDETIKHATNLLKSGKLTHVLEFPMSMYPVDPVIIANEVGPNKRKKMNRSQQTFVQNVLPIYIEDDGLRRSLPTIMQCHGLPSPYNLVFGAGQCWMSSEDD